MEMVYILYHIKTEDNWNIIYYVREDVEKNKI